ncbi:hypothetical protein [Candidatus Uabimicrobium amorphum]|nr:hypothetical protein [Candidatus Uabimicrobium amorphum]
MADWHSDILDKTQEKPVFLHNDRPWNYTLIMGIWGRGGGRGKGGGIFNLCTELRDEFPELPYRNTIAMSWNPGHLENEDPFGTPATMRHISDLYSRIPGSERYKDYPIKDLENRGKKPVYVALIGHSYGGRSVVILSNHLERKANYVATIDPVFGASGDIDGITFGLGIKPKGEVIHNWYQRNAIEFVDHCTGPPIQIPGGISLGQALKGEGVINYKRKFQRGANGEARYMNCPSLIGEDYKAPLYTYHTIIDEDDLIWHKITKQVKEGISLAHTTLVKKTFRATIGRFPMDKKEIEWGYEIASAKGMKALREELVQKFGNLAIQIEYNRYGAIPDDKYGEYKEWLSVHGIDFVGNEIKKRLQNPPSNIVIKNRTAGSSLGVINTSGKMHASESIHLGPNVHIASRKQITFDSKNIILEGVVVERDSKISNGKVMMSAKKTIKLQHGTVIKAAFKGLIKQ